ncbi:MAG: class I SAM-dependent methyltransferase [Symploca sp. SIO1C4]|uniref:Class I SAM-dependent methyltransferase n=1 Tax=Symploca sp. SIO1C4 TaxID=2607765 RepID=A0A6B3N8P4_9CYAN|nr:class I SAM-dependent methyltransferase [Symploca sp. SIO1C4]
MSTELNPLYNSLAFAYTAFANDRDFSREVEALGIKKSSQIEVCELFAGPAYHSIELLRSRCDVKVTAIDNSSLMKIEAQKLGFPEKGEYIVGNVCDTLESLQQAYDYFLILRYSLGLIPPKDLSRLLRAISNRLNFSGCVFIQLHRIDLIVNDFERLSIRERNVVSNSRNITCLWPSGPLKWREDCFEVQMPVTLFVDDERYETVSHEWIYTKTDLERECNLLGMSIERIKSIEQFFKQSCMYRLSFC